MVMDKRTLKQHNSGFTMVETLAVVAILVVLLCISMVSVVRYRDYLKITELDNAARDIYMAAENRAVLLKNGGQIGAPLEEKGTPVTLSVGGVSPLAEGGAAPARCGISKDAAVTSGLLTAGAIDPALLEGDFCIVYEPDTGSVTDVFYTEKSSNVGDINDAFAIAGDRDARMRREGGMLGYYGGENSGNREYTPLPAADGVMVEIHNEERLTVDVTFPAASGANVTREEKVWLEYPDKDRINLLDSEYDSREQTPSGSVTYTWVLDALEDGMHFHQLFPGSSPSATYGGNFTVTAEVKLSVPGHRPSTASASDTGNSLFAEGTDDSTARIENLRHLQNLDADTSKVGGKTGAIQLNDIECTNNDVYPNYEFVPIENEELTAFNVGYAEEKANNAEGGERDATYRRYEVRDLNVTQDSAAGKPGAGLFAKSNNGKKTTEDGAEKISYATFTGIRLINAKVEGNSNQPAGALVGAAGEYNKFEDVHAIDTSVKAKGDAGGIAGAISIGDFFHTVRVVDTQVSSEANAGGIAGGVGGIATSNAELTFENCQVYWDLKGQPNLQDVLGSSEGGYKYQIQGETAGGLLGYVSNRVDIKTSFAATLVKGDTVGGLVGSAMTSVTAEKSYADCYLEGSKTAGGLVGKSGEVTVTNVYTAGFIDGAQKAGHVGGILGEEFASGEVTGDNVYAAMSYQNLKKGCAFIPGVQEGTDCFYMSDNAPKSNAEGGIFYKEMTKPEFVNKMGGGFERKIGNNSHPYNLQEELELNAYDFPGLKGLPHYGDWQASFRTPNLVYYEKYENGNVGFAGGNVRNLFDETVQIDGYAVALGEEELKNFSELQIKYTYLEGKDKKELTSEFKKDGNNKWNSVLPTVAWGEDEAGNPIQYYLFPLPDELVNIDFASGNFYQYLHVQVSSLGGSDAAVAEGDYFYCPHFAETVAYSSEKGDDGAAGGSADELAIDWTNTEEAIKKIDEYIAKNLMRDPLPVSVRTPRHLYMLSKFVEYYHNEKLAYKQGLDLDYKKYEGYDFQNWPAQEPIGTDNSQHNFRGRYDGGCRSITNVNPKLTGVRYAGLFGYSVGTLENIVYIIDREGNNPASLQFTNDIVRLGGLAGCNHGTISNCAVEGVNFAVEASNLQHYIGGFVGENMGRIEHCSAETASLSIEVLNTGEVYAGGFAGRNSSALGIGSCYAVGRISANTKKEVDEAYLCGFVGGNAGGVVHDCWSAMDLQANGAGAASYGFCTPTAGGRQSNTYYLNGGNFTYREKSFLADFDESKSGGAKPASYRQLTGQEDGFAVAGMQVVSTDGGSKSPYFSGVKDGDGSEVHYGQWPEPMPLGTMGLYYWEELQKDGKTTYHFTVLAVDPAKQTITKDSTLSTLHDEGGEVTRYGYGYYRAKDAASGVVGLSSNDLYYSDKGKAEGLFADPNAADGQAKYELLEEAKDGGKDAELSEDNAVDEALAKLNSGFEFHSFHSFGLNGSEDGTGGLYPKAGQQNCTLTLKQKAGSAKLSVTFTLSPFFADAMSADSKVKVDETEQVWTLESQTGGVDFSTKDGQPPGSEDNQYGVRSIAQLKLINWNSENMDTKTVMTEGNVYYAETEQVLVKDQGYYTYDVTYDWWDNPNVLRETKVEKSDDGSVGYYLYSMEGKRLVQGDWVPDKDYYIEYDVVSGNQWSGYYLSPKGGRLVKRQERLETVSVPKYVAFPYLNSRAQTTPYHWQQTYDLVGGSRTYTPIAEYYDATNGNQGKLNGWFGGRYDGGGYMIENVNIQGQVSSCAGLFGVVFDGKLENITLYSSSGEGRISTIATKENGAESRWFAMGALAGAAGTRDKGGNAINNCSVSGYTIDARVYTHSQITGYDDNGNPKTNDWGGNNIGGLVGASDMSLANCSAVVDINVHDATENDNMRVGGLVGICQGSVTQCYAGGAITIKDVTVQRSDRGIYIGGLVGGSYMKPLLIDGTTSTYIGLLNSDSTGNKLTNCYSYVALPPINAHGQLWGLYAIGGTGEIEPRYDSKVEAANHGVCEMSNCYYLESVALSQNTQFIQNGESVQQAIVRLLRAKGNRYYFERKTDMNPNNANSLYYPLATSVTYEQLAGKADIGGQDIYKLLPGFSPVSNTVGSLLTPGRFSYPPASRPELAGLDYPFPTILMKESAHVHYGGWPLNGFYRVDMDGNMLGGATIMVDQLKGEEYQEKLVLSDTTATGGGWKKCKVVGADGMEYAAGEDGKIVSDFITVELPIEDTTDTTGKTYILKITGKTEGTGLLTLTYTTPSGESYSLTVTVHVGVEVHLQPATVYMFPNDETTVELSPVNTAGGELGGVLTLNTIDYTDADVLKAEKDGDKAASVKFTTIGAAKGRQMAVSPGFTYAVSAEPDAKAYNDTGSIGVQIIEPWTVLEQWDVAAVEDEAGGTGTGSDEKQFQATRTITFDKEHEVDGNKLKLVVDKAELQAEKTGLTVGYGKAEDGATENRNSIILTYSFSVQVPEKLPEDEGQAKQQLLEQAEQELAKQMTDDIQLAVTLTMESEDKTLIPKPQTHTLTLTVEKPEPAEKTDAPESASLDALPPEEKKTPAVRRKKRQANEE